MNLDHPAMMICSLTLLNFDNACVDRERLHRRGMTGLSGRPASRIDRLESGNHSICIGHRSDVD